MIIEETLKMEGRVLGALYKVIWRRDRRKGNIVIGFCGWFHSNALSVDFIRIRKSVRLLRYLPRVVAINLTSIVDGCQWKKLFNVGAITLGYQNHGILDGSPLQ